MYELFTLRCTVSELEKGSSPFILETNGKTKISKNSVGSSYTRMIVRCIKFGTHHD